MVQSSSLEGELRKKTEYALAKMIGRRADGRGLVGVFRDGLDVVLPNTEEGGTSS